MFSNLMTLLSNYDDIYDDDIYEMTRVRYFTSGLSILAKYVIFRLTKLN